MKHPLPKSRYWLPLGAKARAGDRVHYASGTTSEVVIANGMTSTKDAPISRAIKRKKRAG